VIAPTKTFWLSAMALALFLGGGAHAEVVLGTPVRGDTRLIQYHYDPDNTYLVLAKPKAVTHLQFAANEQIRSVAAGDTSNWEITPTKDRRNIFIKPKFEGEETSMTVLTDQRTYQFVLRSTGEGKKWHQRVTWLYSTDMLLSLGEQEPAPAQPEVQKVAARTTDAASGGSAPTAQADSSGMPPGLRPDALRFNYTISGDAPFKPLVVFDDGRFTYYKLPANVQELPALFAVIDDKDYSLVNFEVKGEYMVAQRLMPVAVLKLGRAEVRVNQQAEQKRTFLGLNLGN